MPEPSPPPAESLAAELGEELLRRGWRLVTAESLTGGGIARVVTSVAGSSEWFYGGFVAYTLAAKQRMLGVPEELVRRHSMVSEPVVRAMAEGASAATGAELALAVTGIAGPGGGEPSRPVGTVWISWLSQGDYPRSSSFLFDGDRETVRESTIAAALHGAVEMLSACGER